MGIFSNSFPMPFSAARQLVLEVASDASTESVAFTDAGATAQDLNSDTAFVENEGSVTAFFTFTAGAQTVTPGGVTSSNDTLGQPILAGMGMLVFLTPLATHANASTDTGAGTVLRVSLGKGQ